MPPDIPSRFHRHRLLGALKHHHAFNRRRAHGQGRVHVVLQRHRLPPPPTAVCGDDVRGTAIQHPIINRIGAEPTENDAVHRSNAGTSQHRNGRLWNHRHVNNDAIPRLDALREEHIGSAGHFVLQFAISDRARVARLAFEQDGGLVFAIRIIGMPIHTVLAQVDFPTHKPLGERSLPTQCFRPRSLPIQLRRLTGPEGCRVLDGSRVALLIVLHGGHPSPPGKRRRRSKDAIFNKMGFDGFVAHGKMD
jgi:hypothetical protein